MGKMNDMPIINEMWAFLSVDPEDGNEGVISMTVNGTVMPLIAADEKRLKSLTPIAESMAARSGIVVRLVKFHSREHIRDILPMPPKRS